MTIIDSPEPIHLLLTDIVMPGSMDGRDLARTGVRLRPAMRVLLTSGFPDARLPGSGGLTPKIRLLSKPYRREELRRAVRDVLPDRYGLPIDRVIGVGASQSAFHLTTYVNAIDPRDEVFDRRV